MLPDCCKLLENRWFTPAEVKCLCIFPLIYFISFLSCVTLLQKKIRMWWKGVSNSLVSGFRLDSENFSYWYKGEAKVSFLLSLPWSVLIWMKKQQCEGRAVSYSTGVCIWKFHLIVKSFGVRSLLFLKKSWSRESCFI